MGLPPIQWVCVNVTAICLPVQTHLPTNVVHLWMWLLLLLRLFCEATEQGGLLLQGWGEAQSVGSGNPGRLAGGSSCSSSASSEWPLASSLTSRKASSHAISSRKARLLNRGSSADAMASQLSGWMLHKSNFSWIFWASSALKLARKAVSSSWLSHSPTRPSMMGSTVDTVTCLEDDRSLVASRNGSKVVARAATCFHWDAVRFIDWSAVLVTVMSFMTYVIGRRSWFKHASMACVEFHRVATSLTTPVVTSPLPLPAAASVHVLQHCYGLNAQPNAGKIPEACSQLSIPMHGEWRLATYGRREPLRTDPGGWFENLPSCYHISCLITDSCNQLASLHAQIFQHRLRERGNVLCSVPIRKRRIIQTNSPKSPVIVNHVPRERCIGQIHARWPEIRCHRDSINSI